MYVAAACHLFVSINSTFGSCTYGLASILAEDIKPRASCAEEVLGYAHISKGLSSVSVLLRASVFTECCRGTAAELKGSFAVSSH